MNRRGFICGGCWLVFHKNSIIHWPQQGTLSEIVVREFDGGGSAHNVAIDLARLDPKIPIFGQGLVGNDDDGRFLRHSCVEHGIDNSGLRLLDGVETSHTDVMAVTTTGKSTFFHSQGANALLNPHHFDFSNTQAKILHLAAPGMHEVMDAPCREQPNGWVNVLQRARAEGLWTNLGIISTSPEEMRQLVLPCLPFLDSLIVNDYEASALTGIDVVQRGVTSAGAARRAAVSLLAKVALKLVVISFPGGCIAATANGEVYARPCLEMPVGEIKGTNGSEDAFSAGVLYGIHQDWPINDCLSLGLCAAASARRSDSNTAAVGTVSECQALSTSWVWRQPI